jgi:hypothetical protein
MEVLLACTCEGDGEGTPVSCAAEDAREHVHRTSSTAITSSARTVSRQLTGAIKWVGLVRDDVALRREGKDTSR